MYGNQCMENNVHKTIYTYHVNKTCVETNARKTMYTKQYLQNMCTQTICIKNVVYKTMNTKQCIRINL